MAKPVAAQLNQITSPTRSPPIKAGAPRIPCPSERAMIAATPGPGIATANTYARLKTDKPYHVIEQPPAPPGNHYARPPSPPPSHTGAAQPNAVWPRKQ